MARRSPTYAHTKRVTVLVDRGINGYDLPFHEYDGQNSLILFSKFSAFWSASCIREKILANFEQNSLGAKVSFIGCDLVAHCRTIWRYRNV
jgi:hypothetical protein